MIGLLMPSSHIDGHPTRLRSVICRSGTYLKKTEFARLQIFWAREAYISTPGPTLVALTEAALSSSPKPPISCSDGTKEPVSVLRLLISSMEHMIPPRGTGLIVDRLYKSYLRPESCTFMRKTGLLSVTVLTYAATDGKDRHRPILSLS
ncbi:hypothetical protein LIA77_00233 [Sarocladium implicatum]|nr:hypothetical protein LIA77_00233 [Sarocladium implicatum]